MMCLPNGTCGPASLACHSLSAMTTVDFASYFATSGPFASPIRASAYAAASCEGAAQVSSCAARWGDQMRSWPCIANARPSHVASHVVPGDVVDLSSYYMRNTAIVSESGAIITAHTKFMFCA